MEHPRIQSFGRTKSRKLSVRQQGLVDNLLPKIKVPESPIGTLDPNSLFSSNRPCWLEIGFGGGEHLIAQARRNPETGFIGCEPFLDGVAKALGSIDSLGLSNVRIHDSDARDLLGWLKPQSIDRVFILFPDPWPKKRHWKRRIIRGDFLDLLHSRCKPKARIRFATDIASYVNEAVIRFNQHPGYNWTAECADDWSQPPSDHCDTRYQEKNLGDCTPVWLDYVVV